MIIYGCVAEALRLLARCVGFLLLVSTVISVSFLVLNVLMAQELWLASSCSSAVGQSTAKLNPSQAWFIIPILVAPSSCHQHTIHQY